LDEKGPFNSFGRLGRQGGPPRIGGLGDWRDKKKAKHNSFLV